MSLFYTNNHVLEVVKVCFMRCSTLIYMKNLLISWSIVSLIAPPLKIFLIIFCLAAEDLYNDGAKGGDRFDCLTL